jgi:hypothetical protein
MLPSPPKTGPKGYVSGVIPPTNYDWLFVYPTINVAEGTSIQVIDEKFDPYAQKVKKWHFEIANVYTLEVQAGLERAVEASGVVLESIFENKSGKMIGARLVSVSPEIYGESGSVCFLPQPSECNTHEAIETLIDIAYGQNRLEPQWRSKLDIPGIADVENEMNKIKLEFQKRMDDLQLTQKHLDSYRNLFSITESPQIDAVKAVLKDVGFETERTKPGFPVDLQGKELAVEVTSISGKVDSASPKMFQLMRFFEKHSKGEKVLLIANTYKREFPSDRSGKEDFTPQVRDYMKINNVCGMTCVTLFELWKRSKKNPADVKKFILQTRGELRL